VELAGLSSLNQLIINELDFTVIPIGTIHTPFTNLENMPIQPKGAKDVQGCIELLPQYTEGLKDLSGFSHIYLIYQFHKATRTELTVIPFMDTVPRGIYSTRSPLRPNHLGLSIVELISISGSTLQIKGIDVLDGTPVFDIKPFIRAFDQINESLSGWMTASEKDVENRRSDTRFL
jgi:tRNA-Thr(GGU) m(6)t(6)A37 methyltransferase TsaA